MKKIFLIITLLCGILSLDAQNPADNKSTKLRRLPNGPGNEGIQQVPEFIKLDFEKSFPKNIAAWTIEDHIYMAEYKDTVNLGHIVTYDEEGNRVSVQDELVASQYPAPLAEYIANNYPSQGFKVWAMRNTNGTSLYYFTKKPETIWFDSEGKFKNKTKNKTIP